jgi:RNA polymerase sigma-70 factor (ECF subfamily)
VQVPEGDFETFFAGLQPRLVGSLVLFCGDRAVAEELAQDAFARAYERWDGVGALKSPESWTYRVAFNLARSWGRRRLAERRALARQRARSAAVLPEPPDVLALREAVLALPARQRAAIVARFYAGLTVEETAEALGCAPGTVKALVHKGIANLRGAGFGVDDDHEADSREVDAWQV